MIPRAPRGPRRPVWRISAASERKLRVLASGFPQGGPGDRVALLYCAPSMGAVWRVQVPPRGGHPNRSEPQPQKGDRLWEGSGERSRGPMNKNHVGGGAGRGERANDREAPMAKAQKRKRGGRAVKDSVLTWGDLALRLKG